MKPIVVSALYKFVTLEAFGALKNPLLRLMQNHGIRGTLLLAKEGINGTVAGSAQAIEALYAWFNQQPGLKIFHVKRPTTTLCHLIRPK